MHRCRVGLLPRARVAGAAVAACLVMTAAAPHEQSPETGEKNRVAAQALVVEAERLRSQDTAESLRKAIARLEQSIPLWQSSADPSGEAGALNLLGATYRSLGDNRRALQYLAQALTLCRQLGEPARIVETMSQLGAVYHTLGQPDKAAAQYTEALTIARRIGDTRNEAVTLNRMARLYESWGEYDRALEAFSEALQVARKAGDRRTEAAAIGNIGSLHQAAGDDESALEAFRDALARFKELNDRGRQAVALHNIGTVYHRLGETQRAVNFYGDALHLARELGDRHGMVSTLNTLAIAHSALGEHRRARELLTEALAIAREVADPALVAYTLHNLGEVHASMGEREVGLTYQLEALPLRRAAGDRIGEARVLIALGALYASTGQPEKALTHYRDGLALSRDLSDIGGEARALAGLARVERNLADLPTAQGHISEALRLIESQRSRIAIHELRSSYLASAREEYAFYIDVLMELHASRPTEGFAALALQASERARARSLLELLAEAGAEVREDGDPVLLERKRALERRLHAKAQRQIQMLGNEHTNEAAATIAREIDSLTTELAEVEGRIRARSPRYNAVTQPEPVSVRDMQQHLLDSGTVLLEYSLGEERSYVWAVTTATFEGYALPGRAVIEAAARRYCDALGTHQTTPTPHTARSRIPGRETERTYRSAADALSDMVLRPVAAHLGSNRLVIVSDGALQYVPWAALPIPRAVNRVGDDGVRRTGSSDPLISEHEIANVPSASVLAVLRDDARDRTIPAKTLAIVADPVFDRNDIRISREGRRAWPLRTAEEPAMVERSARNMGLLDAQGRIPRLPFTRREAETIVGLVPPGQATAALDFQASRELVTSGALRQYRILHFATHGFLDTDHPGLSGIVLSLVDDRGAPQDGFLRVHELYDLSLPADLVVLSACQTALGKDIRGEGLIGLARGFMHAGATRVVASLWKVDDVATAELMKRFYAALLGDEHRSPAAALRLAQVQMRRDRRWNAPYYWAGFVLQGEWRGWTAFGGS